MSKSKVVNKGKHNNKNNKIKRVNNKQMLSSNNQPSSLFSHFQVTAKSPFCLARKPLCKVNQRLINFLMSLMAKKYYS